MEESRQSMALGVVWYIQQVQNISFVNLLLLLLMMMLMMMMMTVMTISQCIWKKIVFSDLLSLRCIGFGEAVAILINYFAAKADLGPDWKKLLHAQKSINNDKQ